MHITSTAKQAPHKLLHVGIQVNRVEKVQIRVGSCQSAERFTDILEAFAKVLTAVPGYQHISLSQHLCVQPSLRQSGMNLVLQFSRLINFLNHPLQRINHRIPGDSDLVSSNV